MAIKYPKLSENLRNLMSKHATTQKELAKLIGVDQQTVSKYLRQMAEPKIEILYKISNALNVTLHELTDNDIFKNIENDALTKSIPGNILELAKLITELDEDDPKRIAIEALLFKRDTKSDNTKDDKNDK